MSARDGTAAAAAQCGRNTSGGDGGGARDGRVRAKGGGLSDGPWAPTDSRCAGAGEAGLWLAAERLARARVPGRARPRAEDLGSGYTRGGGPDRCGAGAPIAVGWPRAVGLAPIAVGLAPIAASYGRAILIAKDESVPARCAPTAWPKYLERARGRRRERVLVPARVARRSTTSHCAKRFER